MTTKTKQPKREDGKILDGYVPACTKQRMSGCIYSCYIWHIISPAGMQVEDIVKKRENMTV
jgi:hypothetical protein